MLHVYRTLVSDVTSDYSSNVANQFKVKLDLTLPGRRWQVSIASAIVPRMALFHDLQSESLSLMELWGNIDGVSGHQGRKAGFVAANDLKAFEKDYKCTTGVEWMNDMKALLDKRRYANIPVGKKIVESQWVKLEWARDQREPEMKIHHSDPGTAIMVNKKLAKAMQWMDSANGAGTNLVTYYKSHPRETSDLSNNGIVKVDANWMFLSSKVDARLTNLNTAFATANQLHARPLNVSAKVTANAISYAQPLGQVYYAPQGRERYLFMPPVEEFHPVYTQEWDEVTIRVKELDDSLVHFQSDSQCMLRLHFKQDEAPL